MNAKEALALVFGIPRRDGMLSGIPGYIPGLRQKLNCRTCDVKLVRGLPKDFVEYMTDEQKAQFKQLIGYKSKSKKTVSAVPDEVIENTEG
jgi:hypothetical protein